MSFDFREFGSNETHLFPHLQPTSLRKNTHYSIYYNTLARLLLLGIIPLTLLAYFNWKIYKGMKLPSFLSQQENVKEKRRHQESELANVLIGIVVVFILTHALRIFLSFYELSVVVKDVTQHCWPTWSRIAQAFNDLLLIFNSSSNCIIYCTLNSTFRRHIKLYVKEALNKLPFIQMTVTNPETYSS